MGSQQLHLGSWGGVSLQSRYLRPGDATQEEPILKTKQQQQQQKPGAGVEGKVPVAREQKGSLYPYNMVMLKPNKCNVTKLDSRQENWKHMFMRKPRYAAHSTSLIQAAQSYDKPHAHQPATG